MRKLLFITVFTAGLASSGCAPFKNIDNAAQNAELPNLRFETVNQNGNLFDKEQPPLTLWWQALDDKQLGDLIERALDANHDIRVAFQNLESARAFLRLDRAKQLPSLTTELSHTRERSSRDILPSAEITERWNAGANVSWEVDIFGRLRNQVASSKAQLAVSAADLHGVQISVAAEVANTYIQLQSLQSQLTIASRSKGIQQENLKRVEGFVKVGRSNEFDLKRAQAQFELTAAEIPRLNKAYRQVLNRLSVLTATDSKVLMEELNISGQFPSIPPSVAIGRAEDILVNRPDILRAEKMLARAVANYNMQVADFYPQFSLTGSFGYAATDWSTLGETPSETFRFMPTIRWAALDLNRVRSRVAAADANAGAYLATFEKTVWIALTEIDDAIHGFNQLELQRQNVLVAAQASAQAAALARDGYERGRGELRDVLDAESVHLNTARQLVQIDEALIQHLVSLYKSLGGGWKVASEDPRESYAVK